MAVMIHPRLPAGSPPQRVQSDDLVDAVLCDASPPEQDHIRYFESERAWLIARTSPLTVLSTLGVF